MRGAWLGVMQALVGCGERCGPLVTVYRSCAIAAYLEVNPFFYRKSVVSAFKTVVGWGLTEIGTLQVRVGVYYVEVVGSFNFLIVSALPQRLNRFGLAIASLGRV